MQRYFLLLVNILLIWFSYGCDTSPEPEMIQPHIHLFMAPALTQAKPTRVTLSITDSTETRIVNMEKEVGEERSIAFDRVEVSPGKLTITITISYADSTPVTDTKTVTVTPEQNIINFSLDPPNQLAMGIDSDRAFPVRRGEDFEVYVYIRHVKGLFGAAVRLWFDEELISPKEIRNGGFWGTKNVDFISVNDLDVPDKRPRNELNIAWTRLSRKLPKNAEDTKQKLAIIKFTANKPTLPENPALIKFLVVDDGYKDESGNPRAIFRLKTQDDKDVEEFSRLKTALPERKYFIDIR